MVDAWPVVIAVELGVRGDLEQVAVARHVPGQHQEMVVLAVELRVAAAHRPPIDGLVALHTDQRPDAVFLAGAEELDRAVHDAVVGQGQGRLAQAFGFLDQVLDAPQPIKQRVFGMDVQMDKVVSHDTAAGKQIEGVRVATRPAPSAALHKVNRCSIRAD